MSDINFDAVLKKLQDERDARWRTTARGSLLLDHDERIVGEIQRAIGDGWHAMRDGRHLGTYYTEEAAKRAVEKARVSHE
jgi:hypothetical protein